MPWFVWVCIGVFVVLLVPTVAAATAAAFRLFRAAGSLGREMEPRTTRLQAQSDRLKQLSEHASERGELTRARFAALQVSMGRIDVLLWALDDVRAVNAAVRSLVPRK